MYTTNTADARSEELKKKLDARRQWEQASVPFSSSFFIVFFECSTSVGQASILKSSMYSDFI